jgi:hypothetical protein
VTSSKPLINVCRMLSAEILKAMSCVLWLVLFLSVQINLFWVIVFFRNTRKDRTKGIIKRGSNSLKSSMECVEVDRVKSCFLQVSNCFLVTAFRLFFQ